ncbi:uncharacterized protein K02A2.6-like [Toxorhynchites rutilus septentrionalis]|uniref:uncharacterized protein K02A2.6-like n=1 Tax=Toxorhynchites rutilus septentrionalis TaxID=329112 RepID=UPI00247AF089|nr:uncharacterized protein K02A2.6-like [Toxorhynchites rutilus septentrionalis]XP_055623200.1 uncharacterized protein K02A2.6-like [Toxorhynchites rutilus septentrionalis]XP_055623425.1 uncharacterized protein K02A2.6-like [Toxorhynchites rutilus septentrionalis]XP_055633503.1 uncharacterized protein K02A2.6-like [Toxorhynchites rutilus septentrionalis]XP_055634022.1 uncharacterized protein K02A2.6-like [Toxorhynchites rutilus septentrionalis]XP_055634353.1 uncharacterized protein K02A2.6-lik
MKFEVDSGSPVSLIGLADRVKWFNDITLNETKVELRSYCGSKIKVFGTIDVDVACNGKIQVLRLFVVDSKRQPLLGREWMRALQFNWNDVMKNYLSSVNKITLRTPLSGTVRNVLEEFPSVFDDSIGEITKVQASLTLKPNSKPVFLKSRSIPFSIQDVVENEINRMVEKGILLKVNHSEWATPIVPVMKSANKVRLCGDFKLTVNKNLLVDEHPLPTIDELFANMAGGEKFSKLDLAQAYLQMVVRQEDQPILTLNTHL